MSRPDDTFSVEDPYAPKRSNRGCLIAGIVVAVIVGGGLAFLLCCGGMAYFSIGVYADSIGEQLRDNPVVREQIGDIQEVKFNIAASGAVAADNMQAFDVVGSKGSGMLRVRLDDTVQPPKVVSGTLQANGETFDLFPGDAAPADAEADPADAAEPPVVPEPAEPATE